MTAPPVHVRRMAEEDLKSVAAIEHAAFRHNVPSTAMGEESLRDELVRPWSRTWVAVEDVTVRGFLVAWFVVDEVHVLNVAVRAEDRRRGIGRALLAELFEEARRKSVVCMYLEVRPSNLAAIELYRVHGFYGFAVRRSYYSDGEDALEMRLDFDKQGAILFKPDEVPLPKG